MKSRINLKPIGFIRSEHKRADKTPIQPVFAKGCRGRAEILPEFEKGLTDIEGFSHLCVIYHFHKSQKVKLLVKPFLEDNEHGVFATRAPYRPNPIGFSVVRLLKRKGKILYLEGVDMLDNTPILDIKPFVKRFDYRENTKDGWQENVSDKEALKRGKRGYKKTQAATGKRI
ncbi:MAG: tRNA (N6-threonylcarbamoyladenosine(37)-N6)-methyltransferase TrmO [Fibrobacterota bacterium]